VRSSHFESRWKDWFISNAASGRRIGRGGGCSVGEQDASGGNLEALSQTKFFQKCIHWFWKCFKLENYAENRVAFLARRVLITQGVLLLI
jgi:hypothetical protein